MALEKAETAHDFCFIADSVRFIDISWAKAIYAMALKGAKTHDDFKSITDSMENLLEEDEIEQICKENETDFDYIKQSSVKLNLKITGQGEVITLGEVSETEYNQWQNQDEEISDDDDEEITYDFFWDNGKDRKSVV